MKKGMKIAIASEHAGYHLKQEIVAFLGDNDIEVSDLGAQSDNSVDYPYIAADLAEQVASGVFDFGILVCGTGIGMSMAAGKVPGVRAALCTDPYMARMAREHNDANVLCLGAWITGARLSLAIVQAYLDSEFKGQRHLRRIKKIQEVEKRYCRESVNK